MLQRSKERLRARRQSGEGGFTLVELIVVIAILGILAGIVVFAVGGLGDKGKQTANQTTCSILQTAEEAFFASPTAGNGTYVNESNKVGATAQDDLKTAKFLHTTNADFTITGPADGSSYTVVGPTPADCG